VAGSHHIAHSLYGRPSGGDRSGQPARLGRPLQLLLSPGDVVLMHPYLCYRDAPNFSPDIRMQVFFRLWHREHLTWAKGGRLGEDMWIEMPGLLEVLER
jgi:hypothetical protein